MHDQRGPTLHSVSSDEIDERILGHTIAQIVASRFGDGPVVTGIERRRSAYIGSYNSYLVTVHLSTGERFRLFLKDYSISQKSKDEPDHRRARELKIYRDLLSQAELGPPEYYASVWDNAAGRFWIFLEFIDGVIIKEQDVEYGSLAAEWLGQMQGFFVQHPEILNAGDFLIRQDGDFFRSKALLALGNVGQLSTPSASKLARIVSRYEQVIEILETQPTTLVHGGYIPWHILLDFKRTPTRVCAVDWEMAARGPTLYDLAYFTDGMELESRDRLLDTYRRTADQHRVPVSSKAQMTHTLDCLRLHRIFDWLSRSVEKGYTAHKIAYLVDQAEQLSLLVSG
jgi:hypothetical protein